MLFCRSNTVHTVCGWCLSKFDNAYQLGSHKQLCKRRKRRREVPAEAVINVPCNVDDHVDVPYDNDHDFRVTLAAAEPDLRFIATRPPRGHSSWGNVVALTVPSAQTQCDPDQVTDFVALQNHWKEYVQEVCNLCDPKFWYMYDTVRLNHAETTEKVLRRTRELICELPGGSVGRWPVSTKKILDLVHRECGDFAQYITRTSCIDLHHFRLPGVTKVKFSFIDPVYVWIQQCNELYQQNYTLHWDPHELEHPETGEPTYGRGVQFGLLLQTAKSQIPFGGHVALMNLSWDGGDAHQRSRSASPICIQVSVPHVDTWYDMFVSHM